MFNQHARNRFGIAILFALVILALTTNSCIHFAVPHQVPIETVMQAVHDYGRGHQVLPPPAASTASTETEEGYRTDISLLLAEETFAELEKIGGQNRA
jgi:hypothetical protein